MIQIKFEQLCVKSEFFEGSYSGDKLQIIWANLRQYPFFIHCRMKTYILLTMECHLVPWWFRFKCTGLPSLKYCNSLENLAHRFLERLQLLQTFAKFKRKFFRFKIVSRVLNGIWEPLHSWKVENISFIQVLYKSDKLQTFKQIFRTNLNNNDEYIIINMSPRSMSVFFCIPQNKALQFDVLRTFFWSWFKYKFNT